MPLSTLSTFINATPQNLSQFSAFSAIYQLLQSGVPSIAGYTTLITANNDTNFGSKTSNDPGPTFNSENIYINIANALFQGNSSAKSTFETIANGETLEAKLASVYKFLVAPSELTTEGEQAFTAQASFYSNRATELGIPGDTGAAVVAFGSLLNILVRDNNQGIGNSVVDLLAAINDGTAVIPEASTTTTDIETADGAKHDADDGVANTIVAAGNVSNVDSGTFVSFTNSQLKDNPATVSYKADATLANIYLENIQDSSVITVLGSNLTTLNVSGSVAKSATDSTGTLDLFMISQDLVSPSKLTTLNLALTSDVNVIPHAVGALSVKSIDTTGSTGKIDMSAIAVGGDNFTPIQDILSLSSIIGGPGGSSIAIALENYSASSLTLDAGSGTTSLRIVDGIDASSTALQVIIKGGTGANTLVFGDGAGPRADGLGNVKAVDAANVRSGLISFESFDISKDVINVSTLGSFDALTSIEKANVLAATDLSAAAVLAVTNSSNAFTVFDFGGNAYVVSDTTGDGTFNSGDGLIELVGINSADLTATTLVTA